VEPMGQETREHPEGNARVGCGLRNAENARQRQVNAIR